MSAWRRKKISQSWETKYYYDKLAQDADQAEWQAVLQGSAHIMAGTMDDEMAESADQDIEPDAREEKLEGKNRVLEHVQGKTGEIILEREEQLGSAYPFRREQNSLIYDISSDRLPVYELLLGISRAPTLTAGDYVALPRVFEELSKLAGMAYLGEHAVGYHTGWPRPKDMQRFKTMVDDLREASGMHGSEWQWSPGDDLPADPAPALIKDAGLDVVIWRRWPDGRGANLYLLGQCACGNDWLRKDKDLHVPTLGRWFKTPSVDPVRTFFTPHHATKSILLNLSPTAGLVFDRIRIVQALQAQHIATSLAAVKTEMDCALQVARRPPELLEERADKRARRKRGRTTGI